MGTSARSEEKVGARLRGLSTLKQHCKGPPGGNRATVDALFKAEGLGGCGFVLVPSSWVGGA